uniref:SH3 domain-containing protein n=1 Tax=Mesocestoides corti TaxID=53468 RepID=A0A5K3FFY6_MESCO
MDEVGEEEDNRIGSVENGDAYGWSRGSQCNPRNRRIRHSDPVSRGARSPVTPGRKAANCGLGYSTGDRPPKGTDRENPRRGSRNLHQSEPCSKSDRKSGTSPLRPPITEDGCVYLVSLYDYDPATMSPNPGAVDDELPFKEGDIIKVYGDCDEDGFYFGECKGRRGFVPSNMVCEANADEVADYLRQRCPVRGRSTTESSRPLPPGQMKKPHRSRAHHPPVPDQPSGHLDDRPRNVNVDAGGNAPRAFLKHRHLRSGKAEYTEGSKSTRQSGSTDQCIRKRRGTHRPRQCVMEALYDYDPHIYSPNVDVETELKFRAGDRILILSEMDEDGFYVGELESSGRQGLVPSNFLREIPRVSSEGKPRLVNGGDDDDNDSWRNPVYGSTESERGIQPLRESRPSTHSSSRARSKAYPNSGDLESIARPRKPPGKPQENESRQLSRSRISADNDRLDINYVDDDGEGEEDSIITSTVPPANPVEWSNTPFQIPVTTAQQSVTTDHMSSPMMVSNDPGPSLTRTPESEIPKDSFDSDGQEAVIIMDIKSNKHSKSRRKVLSRNSSNEHEHDPGDTKTRRRSVFRSPFKRDSSHN